VVPIGTRHVVGRPYVGNRFLYIWLEAYVVDVNWRPDGALRGKWRIIDWKG
jgi:hypothetical protein